jgi:hypothetical protein
MFGDSKGNPGVVRHVEALVEITKVGRSTLRVLIWCGAALVALATAAAQIKQAVTTFFQHQ